MCAGVRSDDTVTHGYGRVDAGLVTLRIQPISSGRDQPQEQRTAEKIALLVLFPEAAGAPTVPQLGASRRQPSSMGTLSVIARPGSPLVPKDMFRLLDWRIFLSGESVDLWMTYGGTVSTYLVRFWVAIPSSLLRRSATKRNESGTSSLFGALRASSAVRDAYVSTVLEY